MIQNKIQRVTDALRVAEKTHKCSGSPEREATESAHSGRRLREDFLKKKTLELHKKGEQAVLGVFLGPLPWKRAPKLSMNLYVAVETVISLKSSCNSVEILKGCFLSSWRNKENRCSLFIYVCIPLFFYALNTHLRDQLNIGHCSMPGL